ncbi:hypothetical protein JOM56_013511 [Amanita muscaria]
MYIRGSDLLGSALSRKPAGAGPWLAGTYQAVTQSSTGLRLRLICIEAVGRGPGCGFSFMLFAPVSHQRNVNTREKSFGGADNVEPPTLSSHRATARQDLQNIENGHGIDWATAKAMAFGSLMLDGNDMCISGQDAGHGTFSHRHAMSVVDQKTEGMIVPLNDGLNALGKLEKLANSLLSEMAVLGGEDSVQVFTLQHSHRTQFEYDASGNLGEASSFADSIWEAQAHTDLIFCKVTTLEVEGDDP